MTPDQIATILTHAKENGLNGFGGASGAAAVAINRVLFDGKAELVGAFNEALWGKGEPLGHVAVIHDEIVWDADGRPKDIEDLESFGMLAPDDEDYQKMAAELGIAWDEEVANTAVVVTYDEEAEVLEWFDPSGLEEMEAILRAAMKEDAPEDAASCEP
jgi:hypothetical protein